MAGLRTSLQGRASLGALVSLGHAPAQGGGGSIPSLASIERIGAVGHSWVRSMLSEQAATISTLGFTTKAWAHHAAMLSGRKFWVDPAAVEGYSGYRADQVQAAITPAGSTTSYGPSGSKVTIPFGLLSSGVKRAFVCALTNDLTYEAQQQSTTTPNPAPAIARLVSLWTFLRSKGIEPINISLGPRGDAYAGALPTWLAAEAAAAAANGVQNIDIFTPCANGNGWKTGYDWANGIEDPTFLHPGADGCWAMAPVIAAAVVSTQTKAPELVSTTQAKLERGSDSLLVNTLTSAWDGLFASAANWPARVSTGGTSTRSVSAGGIAHFGNLFQVSCAPQAGNFQTDFVTPTLTGLTIGQRYGVLFRVKFDAGGGRPTASDQPDSLAVTIEDLSFNALMRFVSGGADAYSAQGASVPESDVYLEFVATATSHRLRFDQVTRPTSVGGSVAKYAQIGILAAA